jgi:magnesium chelatase family protein
VPHAHRTAGLPPEQPQSPATFLSVLPPMEALEATRIRRAVGLTGGRAAVVTTRPCRTSHHTLSDVGLIGGGQVPMPGEVSLAHHGGALAG